ncbi:MAG TPA: hypothetical protein VIF60_02260 [Burkholderiaceae bacterium]|jgi:hypothetical protein
MQLIHRRHFPVQHYVLVDEDLEFTPEALLAMARSQASHLAELTTGDASNFTLIHNGEGLARRAKPHVHIVCARSRFGKALVYLAIGLKNLFPRMTGNRGA